jgi:hypothetical protein
VDRAFDTAGGGSTAGMRKCFGKFNGISSLLCRHVDTTNKQEKADSDMLRLIES